MKYKLSKHAIERAERRSLSLALIDEVVNHPGNIVKYDNCVNVYQKIINDGKNNYLYRVFINICKKPALIITVYKTSNIKKYEDKV